MNLKDKHKQTVIMQRDSLRGSLSGRQAAAATWVPRLETGTEENLWDRKCQERTRKIHTFGSFNLSYFSLHAQHALHNVREWLSPSHVRDDHLHTSSLVYYYRCV